MVQNIKKIVKHYAIKEDNYKAGLQLKKILMA